MRKMVPIMMRQIIPILNRKSIPVERVIKRSDYDSDKVNNDIALLRLEKRLDFSKYGGTVSPICLPTEATTYYGEKVCKNDNN